MAETRSLIIIAFLLTLFITAATAFAGGRLREVPVDAAVLAAGQQCEPAPDGWRATWIASFEALGEMMKRCQSHRVGAASGDLPDVDFKRLGVLAVEMGQRPSAGYGFDPEAVTAQRAGETVTVTLAYHGPAPGAMSAQVMTSPWILIRLPLEKCREIRVVGPDGSLLAQTQRP